MNESGLAGYPGSESVSVPPATVASVRRTWIRFSDSLFRVFFFLFCFPSSGSSSVILGDTRAFVHTGQSEANEPFLQVQDCYTKTILDPLNDPFEETPGERDTSTSLPSVTSSFFPPFDKCNLRSFCPRSC